MSEVGQANVTSGLPRIWACNWDWCPETFRHGSELSKHLDEVHFKKIVKIRKRDLSAYLRSVRGDSGATDSLLAAFLPTPPEPASHKDVHSETSTTVAGTSSASQHHPANPTTSQELPSRNLPPQPFKAPHSPTLSHSSHPFDRTAALGSSPIRGERSSKSPVSDASSTTSDQLSAKRRRTSFATCAAQSSPMSTPSVASMPPSPALSNMITDAINAAGRINSRSPGSVSPRKLPSSASGTNGQPRPADSQHHMIPLPRRTSLGASPTPGQRSASLQQKAQGSPILMPSVAAGMRAINVRSPASNSVASAQAIEDALTQGVSTAASPAAGANPRLGSLQYPSQSDSSGQSVESQPFLQRQQQGSPSQAASYYGSHAVESIPRLNPYPSSQQPLSPAQVTNAAQSSQPSSSQSARVVPPLPRTRRAKINNAGVTSETPVLPGRTLRSRSRTPAVVPTPTVEAEVPREVPPLPRRTTRSRTPAAAPGPAKTSDSGVQGEEARPKRASSRAPSSEGPKGRARSRSRSKPPSAGAAKKTTTKANLGGLPAVHERPDELVDDTNPPDSKPAAEILEDPLPAFSQAPSADAPSRPQTGFRSGVLYIPLPRRTRAHSASQQQQSQQPPAPQPMRIMEKEVKRELLEDVMGVDTDNQVRVRSDLELSQQGELNASQGVSQSQGGYEEGYGFDMGSLVLQTQAPYKWSQSQ
ncbi:hypothetical protein C8Q73DRAFT_794140 [Cubamyces lactineus]|nr:hypothetical protein C8Q73DRAFT_794140 [Cubamyces lactineus]